MIKLYSPYLGNEIGYLGVSKFTDNYVFVAQTTKPFSELTLRYIADRIREENARRRREAK